jgi:hypothetical protein
MAIAVGDLVLAQYRSSGRIKAGDRSLSSGIWPKAREWQTSAQEPHWGQQEDKKPGISAMHIINTNLRNTMGDD